MKDRITNYIKETLGPSGHVKVDEGNKSICFSFAFQAFWPAMQRDLGLNDWTAETNIRRHAIKPSLKPHPEIKNVIVVASGKGGVGKSTTTVNLALALKHQGLNVGILDADIYGPSQPLMLGLQGEHPTKEGEGIPPLETFGIQSMSLGYLLQNESLPMVWRGPMATRALSQLFFDTRWKNLDYLLIDMPPGTGDIPLTVVQKIPVSAAVVVTTPQDIALLDARKACRMFNKVNIPVLGVVENMSIYECPNCQHQAPLFGHGGGEKLAKEYNVDLLGHLPLTLDIREKTDEGKPDQLFENHKIIGERYHRIASKMTATLSLQKKDYSAAFKQVVVE